MTKRTVFYISDGTGITAETLGHTLLTQFDGFEFRQVTVPFVDNAQKADSLLERIERAYAEDGSRPIVFSTLVESAIQEQIARGSALVLDLFSVFIRPLEEELKARSTHVAGRSHGMADRTSYNVRMESLNFALQHDDGASLQHYSQADVILVGVSRCGKTPTCLYLAMHFGIRAANYPLTIDDIDDVDAYRLSAPLRAYQQRLFGLTIDPERLQQIRSGRRPNSQYASLARCRMEVQAVEEMYAAEGVANLNTTTLSIEEIGSRILQAQGLERRLL